MTIVVLVLILALVAAAGMRFAGRARDHFIDNAAFPPGLSDRVRKRYPHLNEEQLAQVFRALREYFHLCRQARGRMLGMPSQVVDVAWHEFILYTRHYQQFCRKAFGRLLHHTPAEAMVSPTQSSEGLRRTWKLACARAGIDPRRATALPLLFGIDGRLAISDGFHYTLDCSAILATAGATTQRPVYCGSHTGCAGAVGCGGGASSSPADRSGDAASGSCGGGSGCGGGCGGS